MLTSMRRLAGAAATVLILAGCAAPINTRLTAYDPAAG
jgi:hypothetical protein